MRIIVSCTQVYWRKSLQILFVFVYTAMSVKGVWLSSVAFSNVGSPHSRFAPVVFRSLFHILLVVEREGTRESDVTRPEEHYTSP